MPVSFDGLRWGPGAGAVLAALGVIFGMAGQARAHPHVWVEVQTRLIAERGAFSSIHQRWVFDEFYSSMAIEGLDANKDGVLDRSELAELAKVNMEGLKEFDYFTFPTLGGQRLALSEPSEAFLEHVTIESPPGPTMEPLDSATSAAPGGASADDAKGKTAGGDFWSRAWNSLLGKGEPPPPQKPRVLVLEFTIPLQQPVLVEAEGFELSTYDPSYFIWFDLAKKDPVELAGAPAQCEATIREGGTDQAELQRLGEAFFNQMGGAGFIGAAGKAIAVTCPKS